MNMKRVFVSLITLSALICVSSCVEVQQDTPSVVSSNFEGAGKGKLAMDPETGLALVSITEISSPTTFMINSNPAVRFRFIGVRAPDQNDFPTVYDDALYWLHEYVARRPGVSLKLPGQDTTRDPLVGTIYIPDAEGRGSYDVISNMLSEGLLVLKNDGELSDRTTQRLYSQAQERAYRAKKGVWKFVGTTPTPVRTGNEE